MIFNTKTIQNVTFFDKFSDLTGIGPDQAENWSSGPFFYAEQEYTNEKYNCARVLLKKIKKLCRQTGRALVSISLPFLHYKKRKGGGSRGMFFTFAGYANVPSPLVVRNCESAKIHTEPKNPEIASCP